jgi:hypothetical protein
MTDPISTAIAKKGVEAGFAAARGLIQKMFGPAAEEIGLMLGDKARVYRLKNLLSVIAKTDELLRAKSIDPHSVPLRTLLPIIEGASMEDDEALSRKWAGLLASAAASLEPQVGSSEFSSQSSVKSHRMRQLCWIVSLRWVGALNGQHFVNVSLPTLAVPKT